MFLNPEVSEEFFLVSIVFCFWFTFYVRIGSYSGSFSAQMRENTDQNNSEYGHFLPSGSLFYETFLNEQHQKKEKELSSTLTFKSRK